MTNPRGILQTQNTYDAAGRVVTQTLADGGVTRFDYTVVAGTITATQVTDPLGTTRRYRFANGYASERTDALGQAAQTLRAPGTNLVQAQTDRLGRTTTFAHDSAGNVTQQTDALGQTWTYTYDPVFNHLLTATDPLGGTGSFTYDSKGNLTAVTDPLGQTTTFAYNQVGQPVSVTDAVGNTTTFEYDTAGNLTASVDPLGNRTQRTYDSVSRLIAITDPKGAVSRFAYDVLDRLVAVTDALGGIVTFSYDPTGNLLTVTDARGNTTTHTYDGLDRLVARTDPLGRTESYAYDANRNLRTVTDRKGQVTTHTYDAQNRRIASTFADGSSLNLAYDPNGNLVTATDSLTGTITREYDARDRLLTEVTPQGAITYAYDPLSRRVQMQANGLAAVTYTYDPASRLTGVTQGFQTITFSYDAANRRGTLTLPNGVMTTYAYDAASRLIAQTHSGPTGVLGELAYTHDANGNRLATGGSWARTGVPQSVPTSNYDAANEQLAFGPATQTFDANGNLLSQADTAGTTTYTWDTRNRLIGINGPTVTATFAYDAFGRRSTKQINGSATQFHYDGLDIVQQFDSLGTTGYLRSLRLDEAFSFTNRDGTYFSIYDPLGSTQAVFDQSATAQVQYTYDPFGTTSTTNPTFANAFQFTGRENDNTGLYYYRARYYDPIRGRFLTPDPIDLTGSDTNLHAYVDSVGKVVEGNLYTYARNSPTNFTDPHGESAVSIAVRVIRNLLGLGVYGWLTGAMGGKPTNEAELKDTDGDGVPDYEDSERFNPNVPVPWAGGACPIQPTVPFTPKRYPPVIPY